MRRMIGAAVQFSLEPMDVRANLEKAEGWIDACVRESRADLVVLPESFTTGFTPRGSAADLWDAVAPIPGPLTDVGIRWAQRFGIHLVFPTYERGEGRGVVYNTAALIGPSGLLGIYRKTHPFPTERLEGGGWTTPGSTPFCVDTPLGRIGIVICYDGDFPELARATSIRAERCTSWARCAMGMPSARRSMPVARNMVANWA